LEMETALAASAAALKSMTETVDDARASTVEHRGRIAEINEVERISTEEFVFYPI
jgi:hypothetical protein